MALYSENEPIRGLSLCSGVGGLELGLRLAEPRYETLCYVERDAHAAAVLVARMADKAICNAPVWDDLKTFDGRPWRGLVDILSAGYPCQPFSAAGKRLGEKDPRHLWPEVARIIRECQPTRVFLENVEGHLTLGFPIVAGELRTMGYRVKAGLFSACETGASHLRRRLFIMADTDGCRLREPDRNEDRCDWAEISGSNQPKRKANQHGYPCDQLGSHVGDNDNARVATGSTAAPDLSLYPPPPCDYPAWDQVLARQPGLKPGLFGLEHGLAAGMERRHAAGNGVVPMAAALAYCALDCV